MTIRYTWWFILLSKYTPSCERTDPTNVIECWYPGWQPLLVSRMKAQVGTVHCSIFWRPFRIFGSFTILWGFPRWLSYLWDAWLNQQSHWICLLCIYIYDYIILCDIIYIYSIWFNPLLVDTSNACWLISPMLSTTNHLFFCRQLALPRWFPIWTTVPLWLAIAVSVRTGSHDP